MLSSPKKLSHAVFRIWAIFFSLAIFSIILTLFITSQLEGGAAEINETGSLRMQSFQIGYILLKSKEDNENKKQLQSKIDRFDKTLIDLTINNHHRTLPLPYDQNINSDIDKVKNDWHHKIKPILLKILNTNNPDIERSNIKEFDVNIIDFVDNINTLVSYMEKNYSYNTNLLRSCQILLAFMAILGAVILIGCFNNLIIKPLRNLYDGIVKMSQNDLSVQLPVENDYEFGVLARHFNEMANHLQNIYITLEERVETKTKILEEKNRELGILYKVTSSLNEPLDIEILCNRFLQSLKNYLGANASSIFLYDQETNEIELISYDGLCNESLSAASNKCFADEKSLPKCAEYASILTFNISSKNSKLGIFNLYYHETHDLNEQEIKIIETLGHHLGVTIENQLFYEREVQLAILEERNILAQELHDSIAQGLAFLNIQAQLLQDSLKKKNIEEGLDIAKLMREGIQESYDVVRELLAHFRTKMKHDDLDIAIKSTLKKFGAQTGINVDIQQNCGKIILKPEFELQVRHIFQESLSNIRKHANATSVKVLIEQNGDEIKIEVQDNGCGFDIKNNPSVISENHIGLKIMNERALKIGGECLITSIPNVGTTVTIKLQNKQGDLENE